MAAKISLVPVVARWLRRGAQGMTMMRKYPAELPSSLAQILAMKPWRGSNERSSVVAIVATEIGFRGALLRRR